MAGSGFGTVFRITTWGESHGKALGVVVDGCPAGIPLSEEDITPYMNRRRPNGGVMSTQRNEEDKVEILSGVFDGKTTGTPISMLIRNKDERSRDYGNIAESYRPGHADYGFDAKYGFRDYRGGGRSSGRETAGPFREPAVSVRFTHHVGNRMYCQLSASNSPVLYWTRAALMSATTVRSLISRSFVSTWRTAFLPLSFMMGSRIRLNLSTIHL